MPFGGSGPGGFYGKTNFEEQELNPMLDLLESAKPEDLENVGLALGKARDALNDAARELDDYVMQTEWEGEAGTEFRRFGTALAKHSSQLADYANVAATQMTVTSTGLASVRNSRPPRDDRAVPRKVEDFTAAERTEGHPKHADYQKAVAVEKDRQEAINQMNRLASFYAVSEETLAAQEPPKFPRMLKADVPVASPYMSSQGGTGPAHGSSDVTSPHAAADSGQSGSLSGAAGSGSASGGGGKFPDSPEGAVSTGIDSVSAPPSPTTGPSVASPSQANGPAGPAGSPPPFAGPGGGFTTGVPGGRTGVPASSGGTTGPRGAGRPGGPVAGGQSANSGRSGTARGRVAPVGRPGTGSGPGTTAGGATAAGRPGVIGGVGQGPVTGRPGATGSPTGGRGTAGGSTAPRAGGIIGGMPQRTPGGSQGAAPSRGVVGGFGPGGTPAGRAGQPGVVGASPTNGGPRATGRGTPSANGVVGTPRSGTPAAARSRTGGFTAGGTGLVGGRPGRRDPADREEGRGGSRPDYLVEDEETWTAGRRNAAPPVID
jgi:hypothetical protein